MIEYVREGDAKTKDESSDLINVAIEELIRQHYELPAFSTLVRAANRIRVSVYRSFYRQIHILLSGESKNKIDALLIFEQDNIYTSWNFLKQEPGTPTLTHLKKLLNYLAWLSVQNIGAEALSTIPDIKIKRLDISWIQDDLWKFITGYKNINIYPDKINRRYFELCVFTQILWDLKSGDLYVKGSDKFSDYREQLISWEEYEETKALYGQQAGIPVDKAH